MMNQNPEQMIRRLSHIRHTLKTKTQNIEGGAIQKLPSGIMSIGDSNSEEHSQNYPQHRLPASRRPILPDLHILIIKRKLLFGQFDPEQDQIVLGKKNEDKPVINETTNVQILKHLVISSREETGAEDHTGNAESWNTEKINKKRRKM